MRLIDKYWDKYWDGKKAKEEIENEFNTVIHGKTALTREEYEAIWRHEFLHAIMLRRCREEIRFPKWGWFRFQFNRMKRIVREVWKNDNQS